MNFKEVLQKLDAAAAAGADLSPGDALAKEAADCIRMFMTTGTLPPPAFDQEATTIATIMGILDPLNVYMTKRILRYLAERYEEERTK